MGLRATAAGLAIACAAACACNALTGIGNLAVDADAAVPEAGSDAPATRPSTDASAEAAVEAGPTTLCPSAGSSCVPVAPTGWDGPFLVYSGDKSTAPSCPTGLPQNDDENVGDPQGSISCADCRCGSPQNQLCNVGLVEFADMACTPPATGAVDLTICQTADPKAVGSVESTTAVSGGFCGAYVLTKTPSAVTWPNVARLCSRNDAFLADGCPDGSLCVPDGVSPFLPHSCIRQMHADADCPAPWTQKTTTYNNVADTRDCAPYDCSCDTPAGSTCTSLLRVYSASTTCTGTSSTEKAPSSCAVGVASTSARTIPGTAEFAGGGCNPSGTPTSIGTVLAGNDVNTVCCVP